MEDVKYEIERKFLIRYPDLDWLGTAAERSTIRQTYLLSPDPCCSERVRMRVYGDKTEYTHTEKRHISAIRRVENESLISREEYDTLLLRADPARRSIEKTRYCLRSGGMLFEIDVFPFWKDRAFLEIELKSEEQGFAWPGQIQLIREVTDDCRYTNSALARDIPFEEI